MLMSQAHFTCIQKGQDRSFYDFAKRVCVCVCVCVSVTLCGCACVFAKQSCMYCILCVNEWPLIGIV